MFVHIDTSQVHQLAADMRRHADETEAKAEEIVAKVTHDIVATAQAIVPVDTGNLKNSIGAEVSGLTGEAGPTAEYGAYVEFGTSRMSPQPYMGPAFDMNEPKFEASLGELGSRVFGRGA